MKTVSFSKTLMALTLGATALFSHLASADGAYVRLTFGDYNTPSAFEHRQHARWHEGRHEGRQDSRKGSCDCRGERHEGYDKASFIDQRQARQEKAIARGIRSGDLTPYEARQLMQEQAQIRRMEQRFLADGRIDRREWRMLDREMDEARQNIREEKNDWQWRY